MKTKILVIDDEEHIVELLQFNLETSDYIVDYSYDGFDGFLKAKENETEFNTFRLDVTKYKWY